MFIEVLFVIIDVIIVVISFNTILRYGTTSFQILAFFIVKIFGCFHICFFNNFQLRFFPNPQSWFVRAVKVFSLVRKDKTNPFPQTYVFNRIIYVKGKEYILCLLFFGFPVQIVREYNVLAFAICFYQLFFNGYCKCGYSCTHYVFYRFIFKRDDSNKVYTGAFAVLFSFFFCHVFPSICLLIPFFLYNYFYIPGSGCNVWLYDRPRNC